RRTLGRAHDKLQIAHALHLEIEAGKAERVTRTQRSRELLLDLAERASAAAPVAAKANLDHLGIDDDPGVHPVPLRMLRVGEAPCAPVARGRIADDAP